MDNVIYHNPRCSKSRQTLALIQGRDLKIDVVEYLNEPPSVKDLKGICRLLHKKPLEIIRKGEARFKELKLSYEDSRSDEEWCQIMSNNPVLIERPIVIYKGQAVIGRPPENILNIC